jgi:hypothetical protein
MIIIFGTLAGLLGLGAAATVVGRIVYERRMASEIDTPGGGCRLKERAIRYNDARGRNELWVNRNDSGQVFDRIRVPAVGEARWEYDSGLYPYIRWHLTDLEHNQPARY